ncbi:MAG: VOC family protein [Pseudomonadota bacterium]|nr:VOC family protein [Pseudomonadota bacterium]
MTIKAKGVVWVGIGTGRFAENMRLFTRVLGLEVEAEGDEQAILRTANGDQVEIFGKEGRGRSQNTPPTVAFEVDDVGEARDALAAAGVEIVGEIGSWNGHEWLYFRSPDGYLFEVKKTPGFG